MMNEQEFCLGNEAEFRRMDVSHSVFKSVYDTRSGFSKKKQNKLLVKHKLLPSHQY